jgi:hypothetical protein
MMPDQMLMLDRVKPSGTPTERVSSIRRVWSSKVIRSRRCNGYRPLYALIAKSVISPTLEVQAKRKQATMDRALYGARKAIERKALAQRGVFDHWQF